MPPKPIRPNYPVELVATSRRNMSDAIRQALAGAAKTIGTLERCEAHVHPQIVPDGRKHQYQVLLSVTPRHQPLSGAH